jgi:hypothetical protein
MLFKYTSATPTQVEGLPGKKDALHLMPRTTFEITEEQYKWLKENKPDLAKELLNLTPAKVFAPTVQVLKPVGKPKFYNQEPKPDKVDTPPDVSN